MNIAIAALALGYGQLFPPATRQGSSGRRKGHLVRSWSPASDIGAAKAWRWLSQRGESNNHDEPSE